MNQFDKAIAYIKDDSPTAANNVAEDILKAVSGLSKYPERYNPDRYKSNNDSSYLAFETHHYRISYRYKKSEIRIVRLRHTKMNPLSY